MDRGVSFSIRSVSCQHCWIIRAETFFDVLFQPLCPVSAGVTSLPAANSMRPRDLRSILLTFGRYILTSTVVLPGWCRQTSVAVYTSRFIANIILSVCLSIHSFVCHMVQCIEVYCAPHNVLILLVFWGQTDRRIVSGVPYKYSYLLTYLLNTAAVRACLAALRQISSIRHSLSRPALLTLLHALIISKLHYCSTVLLGAPQTLLQWLQSVLSAAARLVFSARKTECMSPLLQELHWLRVPERIKFWLRPLTDDPSFSYEKLLRETWYKKPYVCHHFSYEFFLVWETWIVCQGPKQRKRVDLPLSSQLIFYPVAIKTEDTWHDQAVELIQEIGRRTTTITGDAKETIYLFQQLSVALRRGNTVSFQSMFTIS